MTFAEEIEHAANGETIEAVICGERGWSGSPTSNVMTWADSRPIFDYEYNHDFGGVDCHAVNVWTESKVIFVSQYDGMTNVETIPRSPTPGPVRMFGGG